MKSKKRFHYQIDEVGVYYYICDGGKTEDKIFAEVIGDVEEVTDKLNDLNDENNILKKEIEDFQGLLTKQDTVCYDKVLKIINTKIRELKYDVTYGDIPLDLRLFCVTVLMDLKQEL